MPVNRGRSGSSSSRLATQVATNAVAAVNPTTVMKAEAAGEPSRSKILTIANPVSVAESDHLKIGEFLERCHYCKKRIAQNSEVFMYSNLCAFCSAECRDLQIALDHLAKEHPANPKEVVVHGQGIYNVKSHGS
ncbi:hypothetical protein Pfo_017564 [Paulownia fortunei]|nr:hypothetical protein Pfo_017564 [Paulownia fortunei]